MKSRTVKFTAFSFKVNLPFQNRLKLKHKEAGKRRPKLQEMEKKA